jgi:hypothetical protein
MRIWNGDEQNYKKDDKVWEIRYNGDGSCLQAYDNRDFGVVECGLFFFEMPTTPDRR